MQSLPSLSLVLLSGVPMRRPLIALISIVVCLAGAGSALAGKPPKPGGGGSGAAATVTTMACGDPEVHVRGYVSCPVRVGDAKGTGIPEGIVTFAVTIRLRARYNYRLTIFVNNCHKNSRSSQPFLYPVGRAGCNFL